MEFTMKIVCFNAGFVKRSTLWKFHLLAVHLHLIHCHHLQSSCPYSSKRCHLYCCFYFVMMFSGMLLLYHYWEITISYRNVYLFIILFLLVSLFSPLICCNFMSTCLRIYFKYCKFCFKTYCKLYEFLLSVR